MDYKDIGAIMSSHGFAAEPAFRDVYIEIAPMPDMDGCPLGLYYPGSGLIHIPPDAYGPVVYHELGHRYGHYHYNNLSEQYAEGFREKFQSGTAMLYAGPDFRRLPKMGSLFSEGQRGEVQLAFDRPVTAQHLDMLRQSLHNGSMGEPIPRVCCMQDPNVISVRFTHGVDWLVIVGASLTALALAGVGAIAYAIYKTAKENPWVFPVAIFGGIAGAMLLAGWAGRRSLAVGR
jgi:hypothetical protein